MDVFESAIMDIRKSKVLKSEDIETAIEELVKAKTNMPDNHLNIGSPSKEDLNSIISCQKLIPTPINAVFSKARLLTRKEYKQLRGFIQPVFTMWMILNNDSRDNESLAVVISNGSVGGYWSDSNALLRPVLEYREQGPILELHSGDKVRIGEYCFTVITSGLALSDTLIGKAAGRDPKRVQKQLDSWFDSIRGIQ
jgi:hypothetical protein